MPSNGTETRKSTPAAEVAAFSRHLTAKAADAEMKTNAGKVRTAATGRNRHTRDPSIYGIMPTREIANASTVAVSVKRNRAKRFNTAPRTVGTTIAEIAQPRDGPNTVATSPTFAAIRPPISAPFTVVTDTAVTVTAKTK